MQSMISLVVLLVYLSSTTNARPVTKDNAVGVVWTFPNETWIENLAVRRDGEILATSLSRHAVYLVNPFEHTAVTAHQFASTDGVLGIAEIDVDVFAVVTADVNLKTSKASPGSAKMWTLKMSSNDAVRHPCPRNEKGMLTNGNAQVACVSKTADLQDVLLPDGVVTLPEPGLVLVADAAKGVVWRVDTLTGDYEIAIRDSLFIPTNPAIPLGVDGLHIADHQLYFTNPDDNLLGRIPIDSHGNSAGSAENVTTKLVFPDDFALREDGTAYVAGANTVWRVGRDGDVRVLAGGPHDKTLEGVTSAQLGRTDIDRDVLYLGKCDCSVEKFSH